MNLQTRLIIFIDSKYGLDTILNTLVKYKCFRGYQNYLRAAKAIRKCPLYIRKKFWTWLYYYNVKATPYITLRDYLESAK